MSDPRDEPEAMPSYRDTPEVVETREVRISGGRWAEITEYESGTYRWQHPDGAAGTAPSFREAMDALEAIDNNNDRLRAAGKEV